MWQKKWHNAISSEHRKFKYKQIFSALKYVRSKSKKYR